MKNERTLLEKVRDFLTMSLEETEKETPKVELEEITQMELFTKETPRSDGGFGSTQN